MQKNEKGPLSHQKIKCLILDYVQLLMIGWVIWVMNIDQNAKKWKRPSKSSKNKMFIFWWSTRRLPEDHQKTAKRPAEDKQKTTRSSVEDQQKTARRPPENCQKTTRPSAEQSEQKNVNWNTKKWKRPPKSSKNKMFIFGLCSTSDDWPNDQSRKCWPNVKKTKKAPQVIKK